MLEKALERDEQARPFEVGMKKFGEMIKDDPVLLEQLDATPDKSSFISLYIELAKERGITFSRENMEVAVQEQKQGSNWIIPKNVLRMVADRF